MQTNLQHLNESTPAPFSDIVIHNYQTYLEANGVYLQNRVEYKVETIPINQVIGIHQMRGDDATWGDCLKGSWLRRIKKNLEELRVNPEYYLNETEKAGMSFIKIEDKYFIVTGKHRTIIARFLAHFNPAIFNESPLQAVPVTENFIDHEFIALKAKLLDVAELHPNLEFEIRHTTEVDNRNFLMIGEVDPKGEYESFSREHGQEIIEILTKPSLLGKWRSERQWDVASAYQFINYKQCFKYLLQRISSKS